MAEKMSGQRIIFEAEVRRSQVQEFSTNDWVTAIENLSALSMWEMLRALAGLSQSKRDEVVTQARTILEVRRGWKGASDRIQWAADIVNNLRFKPPPPGLFQTPPDHAEPTEVTDAKVFLEERRSGKRSELITVEQPSMALNAAHIFVRLHMRYTLSIPPITTAQQMIDFVKAKGRLKHLVINCHGYVDHSSGATTLAIGTHFDSSNVGLFTQLKGYVDVFWIAGCLAAGSKPGSDDCRARAQNAECFVVAPAFLMAGAERGFADGQNGHE